MEPFILGFDRPNIKLSVEMKGDWKRQLRAFIARHAGESGIVYCLSRKKTEETAALLVLGGHFKTGQWWSPQKRPMGMARDSVVLPL